MICTLVYAHWHHCHSDKVLLSVSHYFGAYILQFLQGASVWKVKIIMYSDQLDKVFVAMVAEAIIRIACGTINVGKGSLHKHI